MERMDFRHEWKHEINYADLLAIRQRLTAVAEPDAHVRSGIYRIRSLYFDNLSDQVLREKLDGLNRREKFRIRYYNGDTSLIRLEKKSKCGNLSSKQVTALTEQEVQSILNGGWDWMPDSGQELVRELYVKMRVQGLRPKTIVDYIREPFVYAPGNVRVTLDYDIRTALTYSGFLDSQCVTLPVRNAPIILEVKWDAFLPTVIRDAVQLEGRRTAAFSKYAACRIYG